AGDISRAKRHRGSRTTMRSRPFTSISHSAVALSLVGLTTLCTGVARGQAPATTATDELEQVIVTGSRIARPGFDAPTPTTSIGIVEIERAAPANIADFVNLLPQLSASATPRVGNANTSTGFNGLNNLNL